MTDRIYTDFCDFVVIDFQLEEYIKSPLVNENNKVIARAYKETFGDKKVGIVPTSVMQYNRTEANVYTLKFLSDVA